MVAGMAEMPCNSLPSFVLIHSSPDVDLHHSLSGSTPCVVFRYEGNEGRLIAQF